MDNNTKAQSTPKDFFLWLGAIVALYFSVGSLVTLLFTVIDQSMSMNVIGYDPYSGGMSFAIATLIIVFPLYIYLTRLNNKRMRTSSQETDSWARRWGIFLTLFLSGVGMIIDLVTLVYVFLQGEEITSAFLLKVIAILLIFGAVFYYYLKDIQGHWKVNEKLSKRIGVGVVAFVVVSIIGGFFIMGSPETQRTLRYDRDRINGLQSIQYEIINYYQNKQVLPESLEDMRDPLEGMGYFQRDPKTGEAYEYSVVDASAPKPVFEICATFGLPSPVIDESALATDYTDYRVQQLLQENEQWGHEAGRTCFERTVDPEKYEKVPTSIR
jgi:hypothetical protein